MPHLYPAETITYMKKHNMLPVKAVAIGTDYTCIPFWEETNCDYYIIPHEDLADEYIKRGVPKENYCLTVFRCATPLPIIHQKTLPAANAI